MYSKKYKGKCVKKKISKCKDAIKCFDDIMLAYVDKIERDENISEILCNVPLEDFDLGDYTTDFVCTLKDGSLRVRECVRRDRLSHHITVKWMDASRVYWLQRGVKDWGIVTDAKK